MTATLRRECLAGYDEGLLKTLLDSELSAAWRDEVRAHAAGCGACSARLMRLRHDGALVHGRLQLLSGAPSAGAALTQDYPALGARPSVASVLARAKGTQNAGSGDSWGAQPVGWGARAAALAARWSQPAIGHLRPLPLAGGTLAAALLLAASFTNPDVQIFAQGVIQSLRVQQTEPIKIDPALFRALPIGSGQDLSTLGTYAGPTAPRVRAANVQEAARTTGLQLRAPATLPGTLKSTQMIYVSEPAAFTFTYDGAKLVRAAQDFGVKDAALLNELRTLNGVTVKGAVPAVVAFVYGAPPINAGAPTTQAAKSAATQQPSGPFVGFIQMKTPSMDLPPAMNADKIRDLVLRSGALPPQLSNQLLAIQDWKTTLPIVITKGTGTQVPVDGVMGTLVTGELPFPFLVWQKDGTLNVFLGTLSEADLLASARSLQPAR